MIRSPLRRLMITFGGCAILLGLLIPLALSAGGPSDPLGAYPGATAATARAEVVEASRIAGAILFLLLPILAIALPADVSTTAEAVASGGWPTGPGQVVLSRVVEQTGTSRRGPPVVTHVPRVEVRYEMEERAHRTRAVRLDYLPSGGLEEARAVVGRYPQGATVSVAHDPSDPSRAVLEPAPAMPDALLCGALALAAVLSFLWGGLILLRPLPPIAG